MRFFSFFTIVTLLCSLHLRAQKSSLGISVGFTNMVSTINIQGQTQSEGESGFYIGSLAEFAVNKSFTVQTELLHSHVNESPKIFLPILAKFYVAKGFSLHLGPQLGFWLEDFEEG